MKALNEALLERKVDAQYATLSLVLWNSRTLTFTVASAGTLPPLLARNGEIIERRVEGIPIGLLDGQEYDEIQIPAQPEDVLLLYSDGVEDQLRDVSPVMGSADDLESYRETQIDYGRDRLRALLKSASNLPPQQIVERIFEDIDQFRGAMPLTDDQTVIALRVLPQG
jgi:sigma-B regulation protein RsbU (phosphoserine phosphatase)